MSDDMSEVGGETEGVPMSSASSISNDFASELPNVMSETEDSNSYLEPSSSETDSYMGTGACVRACMRACVRVTMSVLVSCVSVVFVCVCILCVCVCVCVCVCITARIHVLSVVCVCVSGV